MLVFSGLVADQSTVLKGKIIDSKTKEPLIGANVIIVGTGQGSASNMNGEFFIKGISEEFVDIKVCNWEDDSIKISFLCHLTRVGSQIMNQGAPIFWAPLLLTK